MNMGQGLNYRLWKICETQLANASQQIVINMLLWRVCLSDLGEVLCSCSEELTIFSVLFL